MSGESDTPSAFRLEKVLVQKITDELEALHNSQELIRRDVSEIKVTLGKFEGRQEGSRENQDGLLKRVEKLESQVDDLRLFKVKVAAYGALGGTVFGAIAAAIVNMVMKGAVK